MKFLSPATRQKLAILLKSKGSQNSALNPMSPNLSPPPVSNNMKLPTPPALPNPNPMNAGRMDAPGKFAALKKRFTGGF